VFFNEMYSLYKLKYFRPPFKSCKRFCIPFIYSGYTYICNMKKIHKIHNTFQFFKNLLHGEREQDIYYNGFTFCSTTRKHFLMQSSNHWGCTIHGLNGMVVFYYVECKQSFFGCKMFTLTSYSFFGNIRHCFFTATFSFCSNCMFSFLDVLQYIGMTSMLNYQLWFANGAHHFTHLLIFP
jgi:hypothetical protein